MTRWTTAAALALCLLACASDPPTRTGWQKPGSSAEELDRDGQTCLRETEDREPNERREWLNTRLLGNRFIDCMETKGWKRVVLHED